MDKVEANENGVQKTPELPDTTTAMAKTTTISTIAVQSGKTRIVIALLHCGDWLQLKILEMIPEIASLGATLSEALDLQKAHDEVLRQLQNKQSPVEELLRQADQLIATQKPRAEVYAAMAESLGRAWKDVNSHLELRKQILDLNVQYHTRAQQFFDRTAALEASCTDTVVPIEVEAVKKFLTNIHELRRGVLEGLMGALQAGSSLLGKLKELGAQGTLDSRPDRLRSSVNKSIFQVQSWLDELNVKRQVLEVTFVRRKTQLEQCLALAILASDLKELEETIRSRRELLVNTNQLGDSSSSAELLKHEHKKLLPEAQQLQERALKITKATEQLVASGCFAGEQATEQAYSVLSTTSEYLSDLQSRDALLDRVIAFFRSAQTALSKLDQLEIQLTTTELKFSSPQLAQLHEQCSKAIDQITSGPLQEGHSILELAGRSGMGMDGVKRTVEELEDKKISLDGLCTAHREENVRIHQALNNFLGQQNELYSWLVNIAEAFLQGHQDMGSDLPMAKDFLNLHNKLLNDLQTKGNEINALLLTLPPLLEYLGDAQRHEVDRKVEELHERWLKLKNVLENRLDLSSVYVKFHTEADIVGKEIDNVEAELSRSGGNVTDEEMQRIEEKWEKLVPLYQSAKNTGLTFISQAEKASEPHLDTKRACVCVESVLDKLARRQLAATRSWQTFHQEVVEKRQTIVLLEETMVESNKTINWVSKLDSQLYPLITTESNNPRDVTAHLEHKLETVLPDIKKAQSEVQQRIKTTETLISKSATPDEKALNIKNRLVELNQKLTEITTEYQILLQVLVAYFNNLAELDKTTENLNASMSKENLPDDVAAVESLIKEHDASRQAVLEMFRFAQNECEQIVPRIRKQEPPAAAEQDIQKLQHILELRKSAWEERWRAQRDALEEHRQVCQFDFDLQHINETIDDLGRQLAGVKCQLGESQAGSKATSDAFVYFEKTVDLLESRIKNFVNSGEQLLAERHVKSPYIEHSVKDLKEKSDDLKKEVANTRRLIDLSTQYFKIVDEAEDWFKNGSRLLVTIARKSTTVKHPEEAQQLLTEIDTFLKPGEAKQDERIKKITDLARELYDAGTKVPQVVSQNREMLDSFNSISKELNDLALNLKIAEEQRELLRKEQEETEAKLAAAKAEAEAAQAAAIAAENARKAAEEAERALKEAAALEEAKRAAEAAERARREAEEIEKARQLKEQALKEAAAAEEARKASEAAERAAREALEEGRRKASEEAARARIEAEKARKEAELALQAIKETTQEITVQKTVTTTEVTQQQTEVLEPPQFTTPLSDAVIQEGAKFNFICRVTGTPLPVVTWFKDGIPIQNNPDYNTAFDQGLCSLTIEETFAEDSARYTCKAVNAAGSAETAAALTVKETEPEEQLVPPSFVKPLEPAVAKEGSQFQFECKVEGNPLPTVQWFKNQECIDNSSDYSITYNNGEAVMKFDKIALADKAEYSCKATNEVGTAQSTASLSIAPLEPTESPTFVSPLSNVMARAGQKIKLECEVTGIPPPTLTWSHNGKQVKETREIKLQRDGNKATLIVYEAFPKDAGTYVVNAANIAGEAASACSISVKGRLPTETSDSELASDMEPVKPSIQLPLANLTSLEGNRIRLDCVIVGQPEPEVIWYHDDRPVKESSDFQLLFQGDRCSLIIHEALIEDAGEYKVVALNSAGEASSKCILSVTPVTTVEPETKPPEEKIEPTGCPPKFNKLLSDVLVSEGDKVIFECNVSGEPKPQIKWLLNNQPIDAGEHLKVTHDAEGNIKLEIESVRPEDRGVYTVKASNASGDAKCFSQLIVKSQKVQESAKQYEEVKTEPVFKEKFSDRSVFENNSTKFECVVFGKPTPKVRWLFNDVPVSGKNFLVSTSGDRQILTIPEATKENQGTISCVAENEAGKSICTAQLSVAPISAITLPDLHKQVEQHVEDSYTMKREILVQTASTKIVSSSEDEPHVEVHKVSSHDEKSFKQVNQQQPFIKESHTKEEFHKVGADTPAVYEKTSVTSVSGSEKVEETQKVTQKVIQEIPLKPAIRARPPKFITPVIGKIVDQGVDVVLEGILDGAPSPEIKWLKNGFELKPSDGVKMTWAHNKATLEIKNTTVNDAGKYTCNAVNEAGTAVSTTDLVVRKTVFPPVFGRRLQAQVIKKGDRVIMEVEITGTPEPTVTWYKDDLPISQNDYRIRSFGNSHTLIIEKADLKHTGKYMVKATNAGGEAQSIADVAVFEPTPDTMVEVVKTVVFEDVRKHETLTSAADTTSSVVQPPKPIEVEIPKTISIPKSTVDYVSDTEISKREFSQVTEQQYSREVKSFRVEQSGPEIPAVPKPIYETVHTPDVPVYSEEKKTEETVESGIETSSISKQSSLQYFVKKMTEGDEVAPPREVKVEPIKPDIYTKFEDVSKVSEVKREIPVPKQTYSFMETSKQVTQDEFKLVPGPPPEICYIPKSEVTKTREEISEKVKKLEESHKELSPAEVPLGAVKILPTFSRSTTEKSSTSGETFRSETTKQSYSSYSSQQSQQPIYRPQAPVETRPLSPRPSAQAIEMEKLWAAPKTPEIERPVSAQSTQSTSDAITMEKSWAHKSSEIHTEKSWPPPEPKPAATWSVQSTLEKKWTPQVSKFESKTVESRVIQEPEPYVPHYIAQVSHTSNVNEQKIAESFRQETVQYSSESQFAEDRNVKPSEIIKSWPPQPKEEFKPSVYTPTFSTLDTLPIRPVSVQDITDEVYLEPGPPPEIGYAEPPREPRKSYVELIEHDLEKNLIEREPSKVLPYAVRTIPPPLPPKKEQPQPPPLPAKPFKMTEPPKKVIEIPSVPFERFPELEPFPFKPDPEKPKPPHAGPTPVPSKFVKGRFTDSDYESDIESTRIPPKWKPASSDTECPSYRRVNVPKVQATGRSRSIDHEPIPPSRFDQPPHFEGPPRPVLSFDAVKKTNLEQTKTQTTKQMTKAFEVKREVPPPLQLKPGSPPTYLVQTDRKPKPESPKLKQKTFVDGYMADTDEPFLEQKKVTRSEFKHEESSHYKHVYQSSETVSKTEREKIFTPKPHVPSKFYQHKKHVSSSAAANKEIVRTPIVSRVSTEHFTQKSDTEATLEPFPFKAEPPRTKKVKVPPPPSPSKFVKGDFRESDYESDYEGRIPPVWRAESDGEPAYRPVRPLLTPTRHTPQQGRTPTPPTEFDNPPQIIGPPRPKFEPIEKIKTTFKPEAVTKPVQKQVVFKPKAVNAKHDITDVIIATPALKPGSPPIIGYAHGPESTRYYRSTTSAPYQNAVQTETSNTMHFNESTENSHRTVSMQQTRKVIRFGEQTRKQESPALEPFPFKPGGGGFKRASVPSPTTPTKFVKGEYRESDYESEVEGVKIRPKWAPSGSDNEEPRYRKVRAPTVIRSSSVPPPQERVVTPLEFDRQPPVISSTDYSATDGVVQKRFQSYQTPQITKSTATKIASHHMDSMTQAFKSKTQKFVTDIMDDVHHKKTAKPVVRSKDDSDAQVYREETRAAQYGTKHVDPDTGLIYFKYDFGYEFGIILPGESKRGEIPVPKKTIFEPPKRTSDIEMPVYHESTKGPQPTPNFQARKSTKNVKWEPTSESEMSDYEGEANKRNKGLLQGSRWEPSSCSPVSLSPSLPSTSPAFNSNNLADTGRRDFDTPPSCPSTPGLGSAQLNAQARRPPMFITPLRDIAVVSGQLARFECIVQSELPVTVLWSKNGRIIENSRDYQLHYRNGVCRLTIPQAYPEDAGTYTCTATNQAGAVGTTATLQVPGERRSSYLK